MKKIGSFNMNKMFSVMVLLGLSGISLNAFSGTAEMCHKGDEIYIAYSAVSAHLDHGDTYGGCVSVPAAVVIMRCEPIAGNGVEVLSASSSLGEAHIQPLMEDVDGLKSNCAEVMGKLLNEGFVKSAVKSGTAEADIDDVEIDTAGEKSLRLYLDYLLIRDAS